MSKSTRYLSIENPTAQNTTQLEGKSFIKLPDAVKKGNDPILFIDLKKRNYWNVDHVMLENNSMIVLKNFDETVMPIESDELGKYIG